uniref:NADH dehydrogenase [ubiquinone] 1 beta subcomplex subunit 8, mitochondrial n=1 Tax=Theropithecus gelada TaxID=9565 RepID=A0A8D2FVW6_THEGE
MAVARAGFLGIQWPQRASQNVVPLGARTASRMTNDMLPASYPRTPEGRAAAPKKYNMCVGDYEPYPDDGMRNPWYSWDQPDLRLNWGEPTHWHLDMYTRNCVDMSPTPVSWNVTCMQLFSFMAFMTFMFWVGDMYPVYQPPGVVARDCNPSYLGG